MRLTQRSILTLVGLGLLLAAISAGLLYAINACLYFAWLTATPADPRQAAWRHWATVWFWIAAGLAAVLLVLAWRLVLAGRSLWRLWQLPGTCRDCGYDLSNSPEVCPECGSVRGPQH